MECEYVEVSVILAGFQSNMKKDLWSEYVEVSVCSTIMIFNTFW